MTNITFSVDEDLHKKMKGHPEIKWNDEHYMAFREHVLEYLKRLDIVKKAASLTSDEKELMDTHPEKGARLLSLVGGILSEAIPIVLAHHQYYFDADSISSEKKKNIPLGAKIIAVADSYDAMITDRPYRSGIEPWKAFEEIEKGSGNRYLPEIVKALKEILLSNARYGKEEKGIS